MADRPLQGKTQPLLLQLDEAAGRQEWGAVERLADRVLTIDPEDEYARSYRHIAERHLSTATRQHDAKPGAALEASDAVRSGRGFFVGREREMARLAGALKDAALGRGRVVMLVGEPGIGKTRLAQELAKSASSRGAKVLWGESFEGKGTPAYWPWIRALQSFAQDCDPQMLRRLLAGRARGIGRIVPELQAEGAVPPDPQASVNPGEARFELFLAVATFLGSASQEAPIMVVLEDLHWSDEPTLKLLEFVAHELARTRILIVGTYRDVEVDRTHPLRATLAALSRERLFERVALRGLERGDLARLLESSTGAQPPAELVALLYERTDGNPLFMHELVLLLEDRGELSADRLRAGRQWSLGIPENVRELIGRRLDRLSKRCNEVLRMAAVIGREFTLQQLQPLMNVAGDEELVGVLEDALATGLLQERGPGAGAYRFSHALTQETLLEELSVTRRVRLHARIAEALEALYGDSVTEHASELADHFARAGAVLGKHKLVRYSKAAGERALEAFAYEKASAHFQRALEAKKGLPMDNETAELEFGLARARVPQREVQEASQGLQRAFEYYVKKGNAKGAVAVAELPFFLGVGNGLQAGMCRQAFALVSPDSLQAGRLLCAYAMSDYERKGDARDAERRLDRALEIAKRKKDLRLELQVLECYFILRIKFEGHPKRDTIEKLHRRLDLAIMLGDRRAEIDCRNEMAKQLEREGRYAEARRQGHASLTAAESLGDRQPLIDALYRNGYLAALSLDYEAARTHLDRGLEIAPYDGGLLMQRSFLEYRLGNFEDGEAHMRRLIDVVEALEHGSGIFSQASTVEVIGLIGHVAGVDTWFPAAIALAQGVERYLPRHNSWVYVRASLACGRALIAVHRGDKAAARRQYDLIRSLGTGQDAAPWLRDASPTHVLGLLAGVLGDVAAARGHFEEALRSARARPNHWALPVILRDYGLALLGGGRSEEAEQARAYLEEAQKLAARMSLRPMEQGIASLRESLSQAAVASVYPDGLTEREAEVLRLIMAGKTDKEIAGALFISAKTVANHVKNLRGKTRTANRAEAAAYGARMGLDTERFRHGGSWT